MYIAINACFFLQLPHTLLLNLLVFNFLQRLPSLIAYIYVFSPLQHHFRCVLCISSSLTGYSSSSLPETDRQIECLMSTECPLRCTRGQKSCLPSSPPGAVTLSPAAILSLGSPLL